MDSCGSQGKKMKDIVPYHEGMERMILDIIGSDIVDELPDEHEQDAEFVTNHVEGMAVLMPNTLAG